MTMFARRQSSSSARMTDEGHRLALDHPDAAEGVAAEGARVRRRGVAVVAVGEKSIVDAVICRGHRQKDEIAALGPQRPRGALPLDGHIGPLASRRERKARRGNNEAEDAGAGLPEAGPPA